MSEFGNVTYDCTEFFLLKTMECLNMKSMLNALNAKSTRPTQN